MCYHNLTEFLDQTNGKTRYYSSSALSIRKKEEEEERIYFDPIIIQQLYDILAKEKLSVPKLAKICGMNASALDTRLRQGYKWPRSEWFRLLEFMNAKKKSD